MWECAGHSRTTLFPSVFIPPHHTLPPTHFPSLRVNPIIRPASANETSLQLVYPSQHTHQEPSLHSHFLFYFIFLSLSLFLTHPHTHTDSHQPVPLNTQTNLSTPTCCSGPRLDRGRPNYPLIACLCLSSCLMCKTQSSGLVDHSGLNIL